MVAWLPLVEGGSSIYQYLQTAQPRIFECSGTVSMKRFVRIFVCLYEKIDRYWMVGRLPLVEGGSSIYQYLQTAQPRFFKCSGTVSLKPFVRLITSFNLEISSKIAIDLFKVFGYTLYSLPLRWLLSIRCARVVCNG